jgi:hypothetical protein
MTTHHALPRPTLPALAAPTILATLLVATAAAVPAKASPAPVGPPVGSKVTKANADEARDFVSEGVLWAVKNGMDMDIVPYEKIAMPSTYLEATEAYGSQTSLADDNRLENWVAGKPFPMIDPNDPKAPVKIMYNFQNTHYFSDDLGLHLVDADTGSLYVDAKGSRSYQVERHFVSDWLRVMQFQGRLHHEPKPAFEDNGDGTFRKSGLYPLIEPFDLKGVGGISYRYTDLLRQDDTWLYLPSLRRVRRMSSAERSDALFGQDIDVDSYGGYAGQIPWFEWRLLGEKPMLASLHGRNLPGKPCPGDGGMTFCESWEMRPSVYVIEGQQLRLLQARDLRRQGNQLRHLLRPLRQLRRALEAGAAEHPHQQPPQSQRRLRVPGAAHVHLRLQRHRHAADARHARVDPRHGVSRRGRLVHRRRLRRGAVGRRRLVPGGRTGGRRSLACEHPRQCGHEARLGAVACSSRRRAVSLA